MAVPTTKAELLAAIETTYAKLIKELQTIPVPLTAAPTLEGHSKGEQMSVRDLVAYLIGWNELVLKWHERSAAGELLDFPRPDTAGMNWVGWRENSTKTTLRFPMPNCWRDWRWPSSGSSG